MTLVIVGILIVGYLLIATERWNNLNKSSVAMFLGVMGWVLYMFNGTDYVLSMHGAEYAEYLGAVVSTPETVKAFIASHVFMQYVTSACQVILFIIATSSIIEVLHANEVFNFLGEWMRTRNSRRLLWTFSIVTFLISANIDNLTSAVTMLFLLRKLIPGERDRLYFSCVILMAANAGGCFTAIGDVTSLILWTKDAITPSAFAGHLALPSLTALLITTWLASCKLPEQVRVSSSLGAYRGDDSYLPRWQRLVLLFVGIGGLWAIPTFHSITLLPPFVGALCVMSLLWVLVHLFTINKLTVIPSSSNHLPWNLQTSDTSQILFFMGIALAVGAICETGAIQVLAGWCDTYIHNIYILTAIFGLVSSVFDSIPLIITSCSMYSVQGPEAVGYMSAFAQNGDYWNLLSFCTAMGGTLLTIGTVAGFAVTSIERIPFLWYINRFSWMVLSGWGAGLIVYYATSLAWS